MSKVRVIADGRNQQFHGSNLAGGNVSIIWIDGQPPGNGPGPHWHDYEEVFVVIEGNVTFVADGETIDGQAGNLIVVPAGVVHRFTSTGPGPLRQIDIHGTDQIVTTWA